MSYRKVETGAISSFRLTSFCGTVTLWVCVFDEWIEMQEQPFDLIANIGKDFDREAIQIAYDSQSKTVNEIDF